MPLKMCRDLAVVDIAIFNFFKPYLVACAADVQLAQSFAYFFEKRDRLKTTFVRPIHVYADMNQLRIGVRQNVAPFACIVFELRRVMVNAQVHAFGLKRATETIESL